VDASSANAAAELNNRGVQQAKAGDFEGGIALVREALAKAPDDAQFTHNLSGMLSDWAALLEQQGRLEQAMKALEESYTLDPHNGAACVRLGDLSYTARNDAKAAMTWWTRAHDTLSSAQWQSVSKRIAQAQRDLQVERTFTTRDTPHFRIRFDDQQHAQQAETLERILEAAYARLVQAMGSGPSRVTVILYTDEGFQRIAGRRDWAFGLYDGRIRLRLDEIGSTYATQILSHELAHAWLAQTYGPRLPAWIHEGFAQLQEPGPPPSAEQQALRAAARGRSAWVPLKWLDRRFSQPSNLEDVERAYAQAYVAVDQLIQRFGLAKFQAMLQQMSDGAPIDQAFERACAPALWSRIDQGVFE